jgi:hypothetical protein
MDIIHKKFNTFGRREYFIVKYKIKHYANGYVNGGACFTAAPFSLVKLSGRLVRVKVKLTICTHDGKF